MNLRILTLLLIIGINMISCGESRTKIEYAGDDISGKVEILRDKTTKEATLKVGLEEDWVLYGGKTVDSISFKNLIAKGHGTGVFPLLNVPTDSRYYFLFVTKTSKAILSDSHLPMAAGYNFRDMGGIKNKEGRYVKWGKVFRADDLSKLTNADLTYLTSIPMTTIVDFRSESEIDEAPDKVPQGLKNHLLLSINPGSLNVSGVMGMKDMIEKIGAEEAMKEINRSLSTDSSHINQYKRFFAALQTDADLPLLFHCTAGKDRTGMGAALFLYSLGVDESIIFEDYRNSNIYLEAKYAPIKQKHPEFSPLFVVKDEYLRAGIDEIVKNYGSVENYLKNMLNVDLDQMKDKFLY